MLWSADLQRAFLTLTYNQQHSLHAYYRPADELTDDQLLDHQTHMAKSRYGLAQSAGKAFRKIERIYLDATKTANGDLQLLHSLLRQKQPQTAGVPIGKGRRIVVSGLARPNINVHAIAKSLIDTATEQVRRERAEGEGDQPTKDAA